MHGLTQIDNGGRERPLRAEELISRKNKFYFEVVFISEERLWQQVMAKGRSLERGLTNRLYGAEIADIMERFSDFPFQVQVWRDLAVARYKLYDATGTWLQSQALLALPTYDEIESAARDYLNETLVPDYFQRLRTDPLGQTPALNIRQANDVTRAFSNLPQEEQVEAAAEFYRASLRNDDWIYSLKDGRYLAQENEAGGYTLMPAEDY